MPPKKTMGASPLKRQIPTQASLPEDDSAAARLTMQKKAGLTLPVARIYKQMKMCRTAHRISNGSAVSIASILEYLLAEVLELSGDQCIEHAKKSQIKKTIKPRHIMLGVKGDEALSALIGEIMMPMSGRPEFLHPELKNKRRKYKKKSREDQDTESSDED